jgi:hypothetical protein
LFGSLLPWFPFCGVGWFFAGLFAPLVWSGRLGRHGVVCSRWAFALGVLGVLSWWAAVAAAVAAPSLCAVYLGAVQIKVHNKTDVMDGVCWLCFTWN